MKPRVMAELLAQYVDRVNAGRDDTEAYLSLFKIHRKELSPLFATVKLLRTLLTKNEPSPVFVDTLGMGLRLAAQQAVREHDHGTRVWPPLTSRRSLLLGAAALGSLASIAALVVLTRSRTTTRVA